MAKRVKVTFFIEPSDPDHDTGMTNDHFEELTRALNDLGGDDYDFEVVEGDGGE